MTKVYPYTEGDLEKILPKLKPVFQGEHSDVHPYRIPTYHHVFSLKCGEEVLAILGGWQIIPGVFELWALVSTEIKKASVSFHRAVQRLITHYFESCSLHRMQMAVKVGYPDELRWAESLGFEREGLMRMYGPDKKDYWLFGKVA